MYFEMYPDNQNEWRWELRSKNHECIAVSSEGYQRRQDCRDAIDLVKSCANAMVIERLR